MRRRRRRRRRSRSQPQSQLFLLLYATLFSLLFKIEFNNLVFTYYSNKLSAAGPGVCYFSLLWN